MDPKATKPVVSEKTVGTASIPVKVVRFVRAVDVRPKGMCESVTSAKLGGTEYQVTYEPGLRHFKVVSKTPEAVRKIFVPETSVLSWEPCD